MIRRPEQRDPCRVFCDLVLLLLLTSHAAAQSGNQGSIEGTVSDPSGALVAGARLGVRHLQTGATFETSSNAAGLFWFPVLAVGAYELTVQHPGFATLVQKEIVVTVGSKTNLHLSLRMAGQTESFEVSGAAPLVGTTRTQFSSTVEQDSIARLPVNGRNFLDFVLLTPGVTRDPQGGLSFAGQFRSSAVLVDGADNTDTFFGEALSGSGRANRAPYQFSLEAVQEFQVNTNSYAAELGRAGAGVINVVTRSGGNQFRGTVFWYYRDRSMNATDLVNNLNREPKAPYHYNQFGASLGGPILPSKLFFFAVYDGQRSTLQNLVTLNLPPNFQLSSNPAVAAFQQQALAYLAPRAVPWNRTLDQNVYLGKLDWRIRARHQLAAGWNGQRFTGKGLEGGGPQNSFEHTGTLLTPTDAAVASLTSVFSSSLVHVVRFSHVRSQNRGTPDSPNPEANVLEASQVVLIIGRTTTSPREISIRRFQFSDTLSGVRGRHSWKAGLDFQRDLISLFNTVNFSGSYRFVSLESFGRSLSGPRSLILGERYIQAFSGDGTPGNTSHPNFVELAGFVQDEWRLHPRLTLTLGLRYDVQVFAKPRVRNPAASLAAAGLDTSFVRTDLNNFAPRLGLAWSPLRNNRLVARLGYGIFYSRTYSQMASRAHFQNGVTVLTHTLQGASVGGPFVPAYPNNLCGAPDSSGLPPSCGAPSNVAGKPLLMLFSRDFAQPYVQQGTLGLEYELRKDLAVSVSYLVVKGTRLHRVRDTNLATPTTPTEIGLAGSTTRLTYQRFSLPRPIAGFDRISLFESNANSIYHALAAQANKRFAQNFQLAASYTYSKVIDDGPDFTAVLGDFRLGSNPADTRADRGPGIIDQRHRLVMNGVWELNYAGRLRGVSKAILAGWELSGILTAQSGQPYSGLVNFDLNNDRNALSDRTPGLGRNTFYPPATISLDPRLTRNVQITERARLVFIGEAFNVFNRGNVTAVRTTQFAHSISAAACGIAGPPCLVPQNIGLAAFGTPTATSGPRIIQLAVKLLF